MEKCSICLGEIGKSKTHRLSCQHGFCRECIYKWFKTQNNSLSCPMCRKTVSFVMTRNTTKLLGISLETEAETETDFEIRYQEEAENEALNNMLHNLEHPLEDYRLQRRSCTLSLRKHLAINQIKQYYKNVEMTNGMIQKLKITDDIFTVIRHNQYLIEEMPRFKQTVINKLIEFNQDSNVLISDFAKKWHYNLFGSQLEV